MTLALLQNPADVQPVEMALFMGATPPYDPSRAAEESAALRAAIEARGMRVTSVRDALRAAPRAAVLALAQASVEAPDDDHRRAAAQALSAWTQHDLVDIVIRRPGLRLHHDPALADISPDAAYESYVLRPLFGLMFPRDHYVDLGEAIALGRLRRRDRARETAVLDVALAHLRGRPAEATITGHLEGGDVAVTESVAVLGVGFRTTPDVPGALWPWVAGGTRTVIVVHDRIRRPGEFHLDHWLALGPGIALVAEDRLDHPDIVATCHHHHTTGAARPTTLRRALHDAGTTVLPLSPDAVERFAANTLFLPGHTAITSNTATKDIADFLAANGIDLVSVPFDEHHKQFGSVHCAVNTVPVPATPPNPAEAPS